MLLERETVLMGFWRILLRFLFSPHICECVLLKVPCSPPPFISLLLHEQPDLCSARLLTSGDLQLYYSLYLDRLRNTIGPWSLIYGRSKLKGLLECGTNPDFHYLSVPQNIVSP